MVALKKFSRGTRRNAESGEPPKEGTVEVRSWEFNVSLADE